ncbi:Zinc resistance conferring protein [Dimargaris cristalligena]|nr:Zinc resistance conferring protein [Dimargaris cristalligena]
MALSRTQKVFIVLGFSITLFLLEVIVGYAVGSIALIADSFHMLNDILGFVVALGAMSLAKRQKFDPQYTYGWKRAEVLGALINAVLLLGLCLTIYIEAIQRFFNPTPIENPEWILGVGTAGLLFNCIGIFLFQDAHVHAHGGGGCSHSHSHDVEADSGPATTVRGSAADLAHHQVLPSGRMDDDTLEGSDSGSDTDGSLAPQATIISVLPPDNSQVINHPARVHDSIIDAAANLSASYRERLSHLPSSSGRRSDSFPTAHGVDSPLNDPRAPLLAAGTHRRLSYHSVAPVADGELQASSSAAPSPPGMVTPAHHSHDHGKAESHGGRLNMRGVFLHVLGDALANLAVIATALIIWLSDSPYRFYFDPAISIVINTVIVYFTLPLVKSASYILLQSVPHTVSIHRVRSEVQNIPGVLSIHELHIWQLSDTQIIASAHVFVPKSLGEDGFMGVAADIKAIMHKHGIHSTTIQPEFVPNAELIENNFEAAQTACLLRCAQSCTTPSCCPVNDQNTRLIDSSSPSDDDRSDGGAHHAHSHDHSHNH